jgi:hypothetical protein
MPPNKSPPHGLFIRYGKFEAAAYGRWAVISLGALIALVVLLTLKVFGVI